MGDFDGHGEGSAPEISARVSVWCSLRCTGIKRLWLEFGSISEVRARVTYLYRDMVQCGGHRW